MILWYYAITISGYYDILILEERPLVDHLLVPLLMFVSFVSRPYNINLYDCFLLNMFYAHTKLMCDKQRPLCESCWRLTTVVFEVFLKLNTHIFVRPQTL